MKNEEPIDYPAWKRAANGISLGLGFWFSVNAHAYTQESGGSHIASIVLFFLSQCGVLYFCGSYLLSRRTVVSNILFVILLLLCVTLTVLDLNKTFY